MEVLDIGRAVLAPARAPLGDKGECAAIRNFGNALFQINMGMLLLIVIKGV